MGRRSLRLARPGCPASHGRIAWFWTGLHGQGPRQRLRHCHAPCLAPDCSWLQHRGQGDGQRPPSWCIEPHGVSLQRIGRHLPEVGARRSSWSTFAVRLHDPLNPEGLHAARQACISGRVFMTGLHIDGVEDGLACHRLGVTQGLGGGHRPSIR